jgi:hypothetical protein
MGLTIEDVIADISDKWLNIDGVEGVGQGKVDDKDCIWVFASNITPEIENTIPSELKGFSVKVMESGIIRAETPCQKKSTPENVKDK